MKKLSLIIMAVAAISVIWVSCGKENLVEDVPATKDQTNDDWLKTGGIVYANNSCELSNGEWGCKCEQTEADDDCSLPTECKAESSLSNYSAALHDMFSVAEIRQRAQNKVRITEPRLIKALKKDGFPLK